MSKLHCAIAACAVAFLLRGPRASGHGFVGDRFFPPTIQLDDPFAADELSLQPFSMAKDSDGARTISAGLELDKEILPGFALGFSDDWFSRKTPGSRAVSGSDNIELSAKLQLLTNAAHEAIVSVGLSADVGGTGYHGLGNDSFTTFSPTLYVGKGLGDLPDSLAMLKPLAVTGEFSQSFPTKSGIPHAFNYGLAVEYSLPYLQQHVKDVGLPRPWRDMIPLVEFSFSTGEDHGQAGVTTGAISPGILWESRYFQLGAEAVIPVNHASGKAVGFACNVQIYLDDLYPKTFGFPLIGGTP